MSLFTIENTFEIEVSPAELFDLANKLEHQAKTVLPGQVIRVKLPQYQNFCFIYKPKAKLAAIAVDNFKDTTDLKQ